MAAHVSLSTLIGISIGKNRHIHWGKRAHLILWSFYIRIQRFQSCLSLCVIWVYLGFIFYSTAFSAAQNEGYKFLCAWWLTILKSSRNDSPWTKSLIQFCLKNLKNLHKFKLFLDFQLNFEVLWLILRWT